MRVAISGMRGRREACCVMRGVRLKVSSSPQVRGKAAEDSEDCRTPKAGAHSTAPDEREASWSAAALCRFQRPTILIAPYYVLRIKPANGLLTHHATRNTSHETKNLNSR